MSSSSNVIAPPASRAAPAAHAPAHAASGGRTAIAPTLASASLLGLTLCSLLIVVIAADRPSFLAPTSRAGFYPAWMAGPLRGLWPSLTSETDTLAWLLSALIAGMYVLYAVALATVPQLRARWTIAAVLALHLVFLLAPPLSYTDVFNYINYGRMGVVHHLNPYATIPLLEPHGDPSYALSNWHRLLSPYGPLFTLLSYALVPLGVSASFWALKLILALASLATLALVWGCATLLGRSPTTAVVLVGCNPIVLVWGLGADHNDILMLFFVVLAVYLLLRGGRGGRGSRGSLGAGIALVTAAFLKASAVVVLPLFALAARRWQFLRGGITATVALGAASVLAFGTSLPNIATQSRLVTAIGVPNLAGLALGQGGETATVHTAVMILLVLALAASAVWVARRPGEWLTASGFALLALLVSLSWTAPWYLLWVLPFAALSSSRALRALTLLSGVYLILAFMPAAPLLACLIHFDPEGTHLAMQHRSEIETLVR